jgi:hypothetical protein
MHDRAMNEPGAGPQMDNDFGVPSFCDWSCNALTTVWVVVEHAVCGRLYLPGAARR